MPRKKYQKKSLLKKKSFHTSSKLKNFDRYGNIVTNVEDGGDPSIIKGYIPRKGYRTITIKRHVPVNEELRKFRFDKKEAVKEQVKLLRHIHVRERNCLRQKDSSDPLAIDSVLSSRPEDLSGDTSLGSLRNFKKLRKESDGELANKTLVTASTSIPQENFFTGPCYSTLSKPVFVDAPSPDSKDEDENSNEESSNYDDEDESSHNPLGGISMKTLINKTSTSKVSVNDSDVEQDSQDSQIIRTKVVKRMQMVASSDEDEDLPPPAKKQQLNGHNSASEDSSSIPDDIINKFTDMWEKIYPFVDKMDVLNIYRQNDWNVKLTMAQLDKTNRQNKNKLKLKEIAQLNKTNRQNKNKNKLKKMAQLDNTKRKNINKHKLKKMAQLDNTNRENINKHKLKKMAQLDNTNRENINKHKLKKMAQLDNTNRENINKHKLKKMAQLDNTTNRENINKSKLKKMDEEASKKRELAEQQEGKKKHKVAEKELESMVITLMKEKLKARKHAWKGKAVARNDTQDLDEDYHFGGSKVYDSEDEDDKSGGEDDAKKSRDRHLVLKFFNEASVGELSAIGECSRRKAEIISQIRPFKDWTDIVFFFIVLFT